MQIQKLQIQTFQNITINILSNNHIYKSHVIPPGWRDDQSSPDSFESILSSDVKSALSHVYLLYTQKQKQIYIINFQNELQFERKRMFTYHI